MSAADSKAAPTSPSAGVGASPATVVVPTKSAQDKRSYRLITLPNRLQALLVHDPETDKAAAAMNVDVGHLSDPDATPGLAHFLEHMLFLGTAKYPDENSYAAYLNAHGGHSNAFTSMENTNYYFDVTHEHLDGALDRFAQFFLHPLFTASATDREMNAVHNENAKNLQQDAWRLFQLLKSTANPKHAFSKFGTGNLETLRDTPKRLGVDVRAELIKFHATYYSANRMRLAVVGRESLDALEQLVTAKFGDVKNLDRAAPVFPADAFSGAELGHVYTVVPVMDMRELQIFWPWPAAKPHYRTKPGSAIAHLLGHEGEGSVLALLKRLGWANALSAGLGQSASSFSAMSCGIELTEAGLARVDEIVAIVYAYVALLRGATEAEWRAHWQEQADVQAMNFRFKGTEHPASYVSGLTAAMGDYAPADALCGGWLFQHFDYKVVSDFVKHMTPQNSRVHVIARDFKGKTTHTERWYGTEYASRPFSAEQLAAWDSAAATKTAHAAQLQLPKPNPFIATDFALRPIPDAKDPADLKYPVLVRAEAKDSKATAAAAAAADAKAADAKPADAKPAAAAAVATPAAATPAAAPAATDAKTEAASGAAAAAAAASAAALAAVHAATLEHAVPGVRLFHKLDNVFRKPKSNIVVDIVSPLAYATPTTTLLTSLYCKLMEDSLQEFAYDADCASLTYQLNNTTTGATLMFRGYNHKLPQLAKAVLARMRNLTVDPTRFALIKEQVERNIRNFDLEQPYSHAVFETSLFLDQKVWTHKERLAACAAITAADVQAHIPRLLAAADLEILVHGNVDRAEAVATAQLIRDTLGVQPLFPSLVPEQRIVQLRDNTRYLRRMVDPNPADPNSCATILYQIGEDTPQLNATLGLLAHIASEPCFNQLRTIETLGYLVWSGVSAVKGVLHYRVIVQSGVHGADYLEARVEAFLEQFAAALAAMPADEFAKNLAAVIAQRLEKDKNLNEECGRHWQEIAKHRYTFDRVDREVEALRRTTLADVLALFNAHIRCNAPQRRKLAVQVFGNKHAFAAGLSSTPPPAPSAAAADKKAAAGEEDGDDDAEDQAAAAAAKPAAAATTTGDAADGAAADGAAADKDKPKEAPKPLPPVPVDHAPTVALDNYLAFKKSMPLHPNYL